VVQRHVSAILLAMYSLFCLACLSFSADGFVRTAKHLLHYTLSPLHAPALDRLETWGGFGRNAARLIRLDESYRDLEARWERNRLDEKRLAALERENERLAALLARAPHPRRAPLAARVLARDANDWFHSVMVQRGRKHGVKVSDPVVALQDGREVLVGQVVEAFEETSRVLLVTDPLCAVSARLGRTGEQGAVEGGGANSLVMNYLLSDSDAREGDEVFTAGLGDVFPDGVLVGAVQRVEGDPKVSFMRAFLKPAARLDKLEEVLVLRRAGA
jgi:rod shape-determining protein MreC